MAVSALSPYITQDHQALAKKRSFDAKLHWVAARVSVVALCALTYVAISPLLYTGLAAYKTVTFCQFLYTAAAWFALAFFASFQTMRETHAKMDAKSHTDCADYFQSVRNWSPEQFSQFLSNQGIRTEDFTADERALLEAHSPGAPLQSLAPLVARCLAAIEQENRAIDGIRSITARTPAQTIASWFPSMNAKTFLDAFHKPSKTDKERYIIHFVGIILSECELAVYRQFLQHPSKTEPTPTLRYFEPQMDVTITAKSIARLRERLRV